MKTSDRMQGEASRPVDTILCLVIVLCIIYICITLYLSSLQHPPIVLHQALLALHCRTNRGKSFMKSARSWIPQQSIVCSIFIVDKSMDISGIAIEPIFISSLRVAKSCQELLQDEEEEYMC